jgi:hypothetical protein
MRQIIVSCQSCGKEETVGEYCPYTGMLYGSGWVLRCDVCGSNLIGTRLATNDCTRYECECEKALDEISYKRSKLC